MKIANGGTLVADDEPAMLKYISDTMRRLGIHSMKICSDGKDAMQTKASLKPDLILTDIHMKPTGDLEFVRWLRSASNSGLGRPSVIFMSASERMATLSSPRVWKT